MQIGLARHFLVPHQKHVALDAAGFARWSAWYDEQASTGDPHAAAQGWDVCYCSDLPRARQTAAVIHGRAADCTALLREVPFAPVVDTRVRLPLMLWQGLARVAWALQHPTQPEGWQASRRRAGAFVDRVCADHAGGRVLVVGHGFLMQLIAAELRRRGFRGRVPLRPRGGAIYVFEGGAVTASHASSSR